jgi:hypothetical protein
VPSKLLQSTSEQTIQKQILEFLEVQKDIKAWKCHSGGVYNKKTGFRKCSRFQISGVSDIVGIVYYPSGLGRFLAIEVKKIGGRLSPAQKLFLADIKRLGGIAFMAYSLDEVIKKLKGHGVTVISD